MNSSPSAAPAPRRQSYTAAPIPAMRFANPIATLRNLFMKRELIWQFTLREIEGRYKGLSLGMLWSIFNPLFMLAIYTFVFGIVLHLTWDEGSGSAAEYAVVLFCGLSVFNILAECLTRAPTLITSNPNYVKKVVFPLEVLPISVFGAAFMHGLISFALLEVAVVATMHAPGWEILLFPLVMLPMAFLCIGAGWLFAALGVFFRDINYLMAFALQAVFFLSPILYSYKKVKFKGVMDFNPLASMIEGARDVLIWGRQPDWPWLLKSFVFSIVFMQLGYMFFMKSKRAFSDVI